MKLIDAFREKSVLVIGDVMLDKYVWGSVTRISPEAPVPIVEVQRESYAPGGAANVASNLSALGGSTTLIGLAGRDVHQGILARELEQRGIRARLIKDDRPTITKTRIMGHQQQLMRVDYEHTHPLDPSAENIIIEAVRSIPADAIIISDYAKGTITQPLYDAIAAFARQKQVPLFVDIKPKRRINYSGATFIKTNHKEACELAGVEHQNGDGMEAIGRLIKDRLKATILMTRGDKGVSIFGTDDSVMHAPTLAKQVFDVTGAGDTFLAAFSLAIISGATLNDAALIANHAAGIKVGKVGTASVTADELRKGIENA